MRAAGELPSQSPSGDSSPRGGAKSRLPLWGRCHAKGMTERARCQRLPRMGCVEALAGCPLSRLTAPAPPRGEPSLASPFGGGGLALARTERAPCGHLPGALPAGKNASLFPWLLSGWRPLRARARSKLFEKSFIKNFYAASRVSSPKNCLYQIKKVYTVHTRRLLSALPFLWSSSSFTSFSVWKNFWAFSPKNSSLTML